MKTRKSHVVCGVSAPPARPTPLAAALLATVLSLPLFVVLTLCQLLI